ncbi:MAG: potassium-transporting ATPase subunit KdpC [Deltaproteobacteria bacterium]|nr:potassium-transporting ATPase subunit KdpC [Deltaproteobacteria bacterium]
MTTIWKPALLIFLTLTVFTGLVYPLAVTGVARLAFPHRANGSLIGPEDKPIASELVGQSFDDPKYLWGRPSATGPVSYNAASSSGSNLGPLNPALAEAARSRIDHLRKADPENAAPVPADLVTASGSGLDPDISPAAAQYQVRRIAAARGIAESQVHAAIDGCAKGRQFGILGMPRVNVLCVNLVLDGIAR